MCGASPGGFSAPAGPLVDAENPWSCTSARMSTIEHSGPRQNISARSVLAPLPHGSAIGCRGRSLTRADVAGSARGLNHLEELADLWCFADLHPELVEDRRQVAHERLLLLGRVPHVDHVEHVVDR